MEVKSIRYFINVAILQK